MRSYRTAIYQKCEQSWVHDSWSAFDPSHGQLENIQELSMRVLCCIIYVLCPVLSPRDERHQHTNLEHVLVAYCIVLYIINRQYRMKEAIVELHQMSAGFR